MNHNWYSTTIMKILLLIFAVILSGCASTPTPNPVEETARRAGNSVYKSAEARVYQGIDRKVNEVTSEVVNGILF